MEEGILTHLNIIYGCFYATTANLGNCQRDRQHVTQPGMFTIQALAQNILLCVLSNRQAQECMVWGSLTSSCWTTSSSLGLTLHGDGVRCGKWSLAGRLAVSKQSHILIPFHVQPGWSLRRPEFPRATKASYGTGKISTKSSSNVPQKVYSLSRVT